MFFLLCVIWCDTVTSAIGPIGRLFVIWYDRGDQIKSDDLF